jgi:hypothetical protein
MRTKEKENKNSRLTAAEDTENINEKKDRNDRMSHQWQQNLKYNNRKMTTITLKSTEKYHQVMKTT